MLKINKKVEYALIALKHIHDRNGEQLVSTRDICDTYDIPFDTTAKVMQIMNNKGILKSFKGVKGGYTLEGSLDKINFLGFSNMIEGDDRIFNCYKNGKQCEKMDFCNIATPLEALNAKINQFLETLSLEELFSGNYIPSSSTVAASEDQEEI